MAKEPRSGIYGVSGEEFTVLSSIRTELVLARTSPASAEWHFWLRFKPPFARARTIRLGTLAELLAVLARNVPIESH